MKRIHLALLATTLAAATVTPALAQEPSASCILAGRIGETGWAPRMPGVALLGANGQPVTRADRQGLAAVRQVRLSAPALLSRCDGNNELAPGEDPPRAKSAVPAAAAGVHGVEAVSFPRLRRGGELVELRLTMAADKVVSVTR